MRCRTLLPAALLGLWLDGTSARAEDGARLYNRECAACHMPAGAGAPGVAPPLRAGVGRLAATEPGRRYLAQALNFGLEGPIEVAGVSYDGHMPAMPQLKATEKAAILNYLIGLASSVARAFTGAEIEAAATPKLAPDAVGKRRPPEPPSSEQAAADYARHCQGCHTAGGEAVGALVPPLRDTAGLFARTARGRAYLVQVPGVANAALDDARLAQLMNWTLSRFSGRQLPSRFRPYSAAEVGRYRGGALTEVDRLRSSLLAEVQAAARAPR